MTSPSKYYSELFYVPNTNNEVAIFKIASTKTKSWYVRIRRMTSKGGYYRRSSKEFSKEKAMSFAIQEWVTIRRAEEKGVNQVVRSTFEKLAYEWLQSRLDNGYSPASTRTIKYQFVNHFIPYFGSTQIDAINEREYIEYLNDYRLDPNKYKGMRKKPTIRTLDAEQANLKSFLRWCVTRGYRNNPVYIRNVVRNQMDMVWDHRKIHKNAPQRRDLVSTEVYDTIRRFYRTKSNVRSGCDVEPRNMLVSRRRMHFYLLTIYNFVCRPGEEILNLKFKDLVAVESDMQAGSFYVRMTTKHGKKVSRPGHRSPEELVYHSDYNYFGYLQKWIHFLKTGVDEYAPGHSQSALDARIKAPTKKKNYSEVELQIQDKLRKEQQAMDDFLEEDRAELEAIRSAKGLYSGATIPGWISFPTDPDSYVFPVMRVDKARSQGYGTLYGGNVYKTIKWNAHATTRYLKTSKPKIKSWAKSNGRLTAELEEQIEAFSPYSVRHIAIRNLIAETGADFSRVAERANTSVSMVEDFYYKYGLKPEGRLVSRHPNPAPKNTKYYSDEVVAEVGGILEIERKKKT
jgi:hypothetical protein